MLNVSEFLDMLLSVDNTGVSLLSMQRWCLLFHNAPFVVLCPWCWILRLNILKTDA